MLNYSQQSLPMSHIHDTEPNAFNMGIQGQTWLHMQKMELAAVVDACCLPSEIKMMLMSSANHSTDLDLNWQSMSVH